MNVSEKDRLVPENHERDKQWFVMRDLKRPNALLPAYKQLAAARMEVFTPMKWLLKTKNGRSVRMEVPFLSDLLFVYGTRSELDPIVDKMPTLQYRFQKGHGYKEPMVVPDVDMERFVHAVRTSENPKYYLPDELTPVMYGRKVHIVGGPLDGYDGRLLSVRGSKVKRLLVELPHFLSVSVEVNPDYVRFPDNDE